MTADEIREAIRKLDHEQVKLEARMRVLEGEREQLLHEGYETPVHPFWAWVNARKGPPHEDSSYVLAKEAWNGALFAVKEYVQDHTSDMSIQGMNRFLEGLVVE